MTMHSLCKVPTPLLRMKAPLRGWTDLPVQWTAVSKVAAHAVNRMLPGHDVITLPNGIDPSVWRVEPRPTDPQRLQIVSVMRLMPRKRPMHLLRILLDIRRRVPESIELKAVIIGTGREQPTMERFIRRHGMRSWVELAGQCDRETIRQVHAAVRRLPRARDARVVRHRRAGGPLRRGPRRGHAGRRRRRVRRGTAARGCWSAAMRTWPRPRRPCSPPRTGCRPCATTTAPTEPATNWARVLELTEAAYRRAGVPDVIDLRRPVGHREVSDRS